MPEIKFATLRKFDGIRIAIEPIRNSVLGIKGGAGFQFSSIFFKKVMELTGKAVLVKTFSGRQEFQAAVNLSSKKNWNNLASGSKLLKK